jgi:hypothetical protein
VIGTPTSAIPAIFVPFVPPVGVATAARATAIGLWLIMLRVPMFGGQAVELVVVCPQESHSGQHDYHDQSDHGHKNDQLCLIHRTIQTRMALVRRSPGPRGHRREPPR